MMEENKQSVIEHRTVVAHGRLAMRERRLRAARERRHGLQVMSFEQLAVRLAGGFVRPVDDDTLRAALRASLSVANTALDLGELNAIRSLPGMVGACVDTLRKVWRAGIDLESRAAAHPRLAALAALEQAVLAELPPMMLRPVDIAACANARLHHAPAILGPVDIVGITELSPCWRELLHALADRVPVRWIAGARSVPDWLDESRIAVEREAASTPIVSVVSTASAYHEAVEALRWARQLIASGTARPEEIAIAAATPADYDDHFLALRSDANLDLHSVHGVAVTATRDGQAAAALADVLVHGLSQARVRRLSALLRGAPGPFGELPEGWTRILPADAPLPSAAAWHRLINRLAPADWPDGADHAPTLRAVVDLLALGAASAETAGETLLHGRPRAIWRMALAAGPASSIDLTLETLRLDDGLDACVSLAWMPASALAASPRPFVRLLGLNSLRWPRGISEDRLLSDHVIPTRELDPLPVNEADRRDFATILATTPKAVTLSRARRDAEGRLLGRSVLLQGLSPQPEIWLARNRTPDHAFSETDRLLARPDEFAALPQAQSALTCWRNWWRADITPHDGLVRPDHPVIQTLLNRTYSANSLTRMLRNPLGFVWQYGLGWRAPETGAEPLVLDNLATGNLIHATLDLALRTLDASGALTPSNASNRETAITQAVDTALRTVATVWEDEQAVPPRVIWQRTLDDARTVSLLALLHEGTPFVHARAYAEVPFGGSSPKNDAEPPWQADTIVTIPGTSLRVAGYIDRLDVSPDRKSARVIDYKTGRKPKDDIVLNGGRELQRCLYAFAVRALIGADVAISAALLYPRDGAELRLIDPDETLDTLTAHLQAAHASLLTGNGIPGTDTGGDFDDLAFALPANAAATYGQRKWPAIVQRLGAAADIWEAR